METSKQHSTPHKDKGDRSKGDSHRKSQNKNNRNGQHKRKNDNQFICVVCQKSFDNDLKKECAKCSNITCEMCSKFSEELNGIMCNDCEFVDQLQQKGKKKDDKKDWIKTAAAGLLSTIGSKSQKQSQQQNALSTYVDPTQDSNQQHESLFPTLLASSSKKLKNIAKKSSMSVQSNKIKRKESNIFGKGLFSRGSKDVPSTPNSVATEHSSILDSSNVDSSMITPSKIDDEQLTDTEEVEEELAINDVVEAKSSVFVDTAPISKEDELEKLKKENDSLRSKISDIESVLVSTQEKLVHSEIEKASLVQKNKQLEDEVLKLNIIAATRTERSDTTSDLQSDFQERERSETTPTVTTESTESIEPDFEPVAKEESSKVSIKDEEDYNTKNVKNDKINIPVPPPLPNLAKSADANPIEAVIASTAVNEVVVASVAVVASTIPIPPPLPKLAKSLIKNSNLLAARTAVDEKRAESPTELLSPESTQQGDSTKERGQNAPSQSSNERKQAGNNPKSSKYGRKESIRQLVQKKSQSLKDLPSPRENEANEEIKEKPAQKAELRPVFWNIIPGNKVEGTLWDEIGSNVDDIIKDDVLSHFQTLEEKFAKPKPSAVVIVAPGISERGLVRANSSDNGNESNSNSQAGSESSASLGIKRTATMSVAAAKPKLLDATRSQNIQIALGRTLLKDPAAIKRLRQGIINLDRSILTPDVVTQLLNYIPTPEESKRIEHLLKEYPSDSDYWVGLSPVDDFAVQMSTVPRLRQRLQCLFVESSFESQSKALAEAVSDYELACKSLKESAHWKQLLKLVLVCGNYLNDSNPARAGAWGFELTTGLPKLGETKAGSKYSLLHWIVEVGSETCPTIFKLSQELSILDKVEKIKIDDLKAELLSLTKGVQVMKREVEVCELAADNSDSSVEGAKEFAESLGPFCKTTAIPMIEDVSKRLVVLETAARDIVLFHGEKDTTVTSQKLFEVIMSFCKSLEKVYVDVQNEKKAQAAAAATALSNAEGSTDGKDIESKEISRSNVAKKLELELGKNQLNQKILRGDMKNALGVGHGLNLSDIRGQLSRLTKTTSDSIVTQQSNEEKQLETNQ